MNVTADHLTLTLVMETNTNTSKWELTAMTADYSASLEGGGAITQKDPILVAPKSGYTDDDANAVCANGYRICSPTTLCWTCDEQNLLPDVPTQTEAKYMAGVIMPGMKLQPFLKSNDTKADDGANSTNAFAMYNWDCDPVISIGTWMGLLLSLLFVSIVSWGISYLGNAHTPTKFDDPNGPPISVPIGD